MAAGDFNADGRDDLAIVNFIPDTVSVLLSQGNGSFFAKTDFATGSFPSFVASEDLGGDDRDDLAVVNESSDTISILHANGSPTARPNADAIAFGRIAPGRASSNRRVRFTNGGGGRLEIDQARLVGSDFDDFEIEEDNCTNRILRVGEFCEVALSLSPRTEGFAHARLELDDNAPDSPQKVELTGFGAPPDLGLCNGLAVTIAGTQGDDVITGTPGVDVITAGAGDDVVSAGAGNDVVCGRAGEDTIDGGTNADNIVGGPGSDGITAGDGDDSVLGSDGDDGVFAGAGTDQIRGQSGDDVIFGQAGTDTGLGGSGDDFFDGGPTPTP